MKLAHWNPLRELEGISERLNRFLSHSRNQQTETHQMDGKEMMTIPDWYPSVDVLETDAEYYLKVEVPEVNKRDIRVTVDNKVLFLQGERREEPKGPGHQIHRLERAYGRFLRSFTLPDSVEVARVKAEFRDGMLYVHLPKSAHAQIKAIDVKAA
ncbi:MAG: Hsp20/alpha crystallin family protein [Nitrospira sp.]